MTDGLSQRHRALPMLLALLAIAWLAVVTPDAARAAAADVSATFDIPAQSLDATLNSLAIQANLQIFFQEQQVTGATAPAVTGTMTAREALKLALSSTSLEYIENADGTVLVRRRPVARAAAPVAAPTPAAAPVAATPPPADIVVPATEGTWMLRGRILSLDPRNRSFPMDAPTGGAAIPRDGVETNSRWYPEIDVEHFFSRHWSAELAITAPEYQDLRVESPAGSFARVGTFKQMPSYLTVKYGFFPDSAFRPYVGIGANVTTFTHVSAAPYGLNSTSFGPAAQLGFDILTSGNWFLNADIKWASVHPDLQFNGAPQGGFRVDPLLYGVGIGYRFGGTPAHTIHAPVKAFVAPIDSDGDGVPDDRDRCPNTPAGVQVDSNGCPIDSDNDGVPDYLDKCPATPAGVTVDAQGCPIDSDGDGVPDYLDRCPGTPHGIKVDAQGCEIEEVVLRGVNFETGSSKLTASSSETLDSVIAILKLRPGAKVEIHGYTDSVGSAESNQRLSERRARSVVAYLVKAGQPADSLTARGFGLTHPVASNATAEGRAENRRVTVAFMRPVAR